MSLVVILALLLVLAGGLLAAFWVMPAWRNWKAVDAEREVLEGKVSLPASALGDPMLIQRDIEFLERQLSSVPKGMTRGAIALEQIKQSALSKGLHQIQLRITEEVGSKDGSVRFEVDVRGDYAQLGGWLESLPQELPWLELRRSKFGRAGAGSERQDMGIAMSLMLLLPPEGSVGATQ